jgi:RimJ/RimL family protein N-acetyltransferase
MVDAARYDAIEVLKDGTTVKVRAVHADDKRRFAEAFRNLETESIYTRFFHHKKGLSDADLKHATEVDFENEVALVVTIGTQDHEVIIGGGRYVTLDSAPKPRTAEVAFMVEEDFHRLGMARLLLRHLAIIARAKGLVQFEAEVLPGNTGMLNVFARSGLPMVRAHGGGSVHVTLSLTGGES